MPKNSLKGTRKISTGKKSSKKGSKKNGSNDSDIQEYEELLNEITSTHDGMQALSMQNNGQLNMMGMPQRHDGPVDALTVENMVTKNFNNTNGGIAKLLGGINTTQDYSQMGAMSHMPQMGAMSEMGAMQSQVPVMQTQMGAMGMGMGMTQMGSTSPLGFNGAPQGGFSVNSVNPQGPSPKIGDDLAGMLSGGDVKSLSLLGGVPRYA